MRLKLLITLAVVSACTTSARAFYTEYVCSAQDLAGRRYLATGSNPYHTQDDAVAECLKHASECFRTGCAAARRGD